MPAIDPGVAALVLAAALLHATWNALLKSDADRLVAFGLIALAGGVFGLGMLPFVPPPGPAAWPYLIASVIVHHVYYFCLLQAYRHGDLSLVYPIARGLGPFLVALSSGLLIGESLSAGELAGVALISLGLGSLALSNGWPQGRDWHPVTFAVATGVTIAAYTYLDGLGGRAAIEVLSYVAWLNVLEAPWMPLLAVVLRRRALLPYLRQHWWRGTLGGFIAAAAYAISIWAFTLGAIAHVAALRETSVIFAALIGTLFLREAFGPRRIVAAAVVAAGVVLLTLGA